MSGPSGENTKASKIERILTRQRELDVLLSNIAALMRLNRETDTETIAMLTAVVKSQEEQLNRQEGQLDRIRKYVGSILFKRRQLMVASLNRIPVLNDAQEPKWGNNR
jgi:DNA-binding transcriptional MerR regulator